MLATCDFAVTAYPSYSRDDVMNALEIKADRLRGLTCTLHKLNPQGWNHKRFKRSFSYESFEVLKSFKTLIDLHGEKEAILLIHQVCKEKFSDA